MKTLLPYLQDIWRMWTFSLRTGAYRGFRDWNICYERVFEYGIIRSLIRKEHPRNVLDVAGDISLFGCYVADSEGCNVDILDMSDLEYCESIRQRLPPAVQERVRLIPHTRAEEVAHSDSATYDFIYCISAIEHFQQDGDVRFVRSIGAALRAGGTLAITAPFTPGAATAIKHRAATYYSGQPDNDDTFYMKHYSVEDIGRLAEASGLVAEKIVYAGEVINFYDPIFLFQADPSRPKLWRWLCGRLVLLIGMFSPIYPLLFMRQSANPHEFKQGQKRTKIYNPDTFLLVLRKNKTSGSL